MKFFWCFIQKELYEVCLVRIKEQVGEKGSTVGTDNNAESLLKNTSIMHNKYGVNQNIDLFDDISFR